MYKNTQFLKSLKNALCGLLYAIKNERNMRFHFCIANLICLFAYFYGLSRTQWAILFITILLVISCEMLNTAIERAVDTATHQFNLDAMHSKDCSAAATLICAVFALLVGICLFGDFAKICAALKALFGCAFSGFAQFLFFLSVLILNICLLSYKEKK